ncbi:DoxX family membrane protein [Nocardioides convexus]|uniref:DoxX family membrane protein n=1 Tax=Nocardioides convexus TaxID=2712224 RepID=UPI002418AA17|nr:DoxX family membrane protein [Nocardioides convexus]
MGIPLPAAAAAFALVAEIGGGALLLLGLLTPLAGILVIAQMAGAFWFAHRGTEVMSADGGWEPGRADRLPGPGDRRHRRRPLLRRRAHRRAPDGAGDRLSGPRRGRLRASRPRRRSAGARTARTAPRRRTR